MTSRARGAAPCGASHSYTDDPLAFQGLDRGRAAAGAMGRPTDYLPGALQNEIQSRLAARFPRYASPKCPRR